MNNKHTFKISDSIKTHVDGSLSMIKGGITIPPLYNFYKTHKADYYRIFNTKTGYIILDDVHFSSIEKVKTAVGLLSLGHYLPDQMLNNYKKHSNHKRIINKLLNKHLSSKSYVDVVVLVYELITYEKTALKTVSMESVYDEEYLKDLTKQVNKIHYSNKAEDSKRRHFIKILCNYPKVDELLEILGEL